MTSQANTQVSNEVITVVNSIVGKLTAIKDGETTIDRNNMSRENETHIDVWNALTDLQARSGKTSVTFKELAQAAGTTAHLCRHHCYGFRSAGLVRIYREEGSRAYRICRTAKQAA